MKTSKIILTLVDLTVDRVTIQRMKEGALLSNFKRWLVYEGTVAPLCLTACNVNTSTLLSSIKLFNIEVIQQYVENTDTFIP
jgi:hypothetical protein